MKVLHLSPELSSVGVRRYAIDLIAKLQEQGIGNALLCPAHSAGSALQPLLSVGIRPIPLRFTNLLGALRHIATLQRQLENDMPDILQAYTPQAAMLAWWVCRRLPNNIRPRLIAVRTGFSRGKLANAILKRMDALVYTSKYLRQTYSGNSPRENKQAWVIPYGIDERLLGVGDPTIPRNDSANAAPFPSSASEEWNICIPCPITPIHGLEDLAVIIPTLRQKSIPAHAYIVGDTRLASPRYLKKLRTLFKRSEAAPHITWLGHRSDLRDILRRCDVTLSLERIPSSHNGTVLEALALGCPVAGYGHGAVGEMLGSFLPEGSIPPGDVAAVLDTLQQWHAYPPDTPHRIPYPYSLSHSAQNFIELYKNLLAER